MSSSADVAEAPIVVDDAVPAPPPAEQTTASGRAAQGRFARAKALVTAHPFAVGLVVFLIALGARLALILSARLFGDEINVWELARGIASGKDFPLLGQSITGGGAKNPGPLVYYMVAPVFFFTSAPEAGNALVALYGALAVVVYWHALRAEFGDIGALLAALLMACSPWSTLYADRMWNPNLVGIFVSTAFAAACRLRRAPSLGAVVVLFMSIGATLQLHMSAPIVWVALLPLFVPTMKRWRWTWLPIAVAATLVLYVPMFIHELRTHWSNTLTFLHESASNASDDYVRTPLWAFRLLTLDITYHQMHGYWGPHSEAEMVRFLLKGDTDFQYGPLRWFFLALSVVFAVFALLVAAVVAWGREGRRGSHPFFWAAVFGLVANTALLGISHKGLHGHYVQELLPFYFVAFAALGRWAEASVRRAVLVFTAGVLVCVGGVDAAVWVSQINDGRNGLLTMRRLIAAIEREDPRATRASISTGFRSRAEFAYNHLTELDKAHPFHFDPGDQYRLLMSNQPAPRGGRPILKTYPVTLYKMR
jgi:hypothetical protein